MKPPGIGPHVLVLVSFTRVPFWGYPSFDPHPCSHLEHPRSPLRPTPCGGARTSPPSPLARWVLEGPPSHPASGHTLHFFPWWLSLYFSGDPNRVHFYWAGHWPSEPCFFLRGRCWAEKVPRRYTWSPAAWFFP